MDLNDVMGNDDSNLSDFMNDMQTTTTPPAEALPLMEPSVLQNNNQEPELLSVNGKIPLFDDWCNKEGMVHQYFEKCGRVCSNADGNIGYHNASIHNAPLDWKNTKRGFDLKYAWGKDNIEEKIKLCPEAELDKIWDRTTKPWILKGDLTSSVFPTYKGIKEEVFNHKLAFNDPLAEFNKQKPKTREECNIECTNDKDCIGYNLYPSKQEGEYYCFYAKQGTRMISKTDIEEMDRLKYFGSHPNAVKKIFEY